MARTPALRGGLEVFALVYLAGIAAYFAVLGLGWARDGWLGFLREMTLYVFVPLPPLLLASLLLRARRALALVVIPLTLFTYFYGPQFLPRAPVDSNGHTLRVLTFNAGGNEGGGQAEPLIRLLRAERADLVALQELPRPTLAILTTTLGTEYPYQASTPDVATFSRFPLLDASDFRLHETAYLCQSMDVEIAGQLLRLTNVHVKRPTSGLSLRQVWSWARAYDTDWRDAQVDALVGHIRHVWGPQLVLGDFNQTPWSPSYPPVAAELRDSFGEVGWGFGHTFPARLAGTGWALSLPLLRIDYVFHSQELQAQAARVGPESSSHHLPVIVDLAYH